MTISLTAASLRFPTRAVAAVLATVASLLVPGLACAQEMDFGGMYGYHGPLPGAAFPNPITQTASCPATYNAYLVLGTPNVDWSLYWCGRTHQSTVPADYDFGGMYAYASSTQDGAVPWRGTDAFVNPFTQTTTCPGGYTASQVYGTANVDNRAYICWRTHKTSGASMRFAGMMNAGPTPVANPASAPSPACPSGFTRYITFGTPNVDLPFYYCGIAVNASLINAGAGSLGIGEPIVPNTITNGWNLNEQIGEVLALHPRVVRLWMLNWQMFAGLSGGTVQPNPTNLQIYQDAVNQFTQAGVTVVGMDNSYPSWMTGSTDPSDATAIPCRNLAAGSAYMNFLANWKVTWAAEAKAFPGIRLWEVGNETNGAGVLLPIQHGAGSCGKTVFTYQDRKLITLDLMYWGKAGIKSANANATVFMPAAAPVTANDAATLDTSLAGIKTWMGDLYAAIAAGSGPSTSARDYFDGANWHPYIFTDATTATWVNANTAIHNVLASYGDGSIQVLLSEDGYTTPDDPSTQLAMNHTIALSQQNLPWLTYLIWFRAFAGSYDPSFAIVVGDPFKNTLSADTFCSFTGCGNLPDKQF